MTLLNTTGLRVNLEYAIPHLQSLYPSELPLHFLLTADQDYKSTRGWTATETQTGPST